MKKLFLYQKGLLFIGCYFIFSLVTLIVFDTSANPDVELNSKPYSFYLDQVKGPVLEKTETFFTEEAKKISNANVALRKAYDDYYDGKISKKEFLAVSRPLEEIVQNEKGFNLLFYQYSYVREQPDNRYFLYTNGWDGLLSHDSLDFLFLLLLLVLVTPVFCYEYESRMEALILTVKKGIKVQAATKMILVLVTVTIICLLSAALKYGFFYFKYGLENGNYPLQSLAYFGTSTKDLSLFETFLWMTACKLFGNLSFAMLIMFVGVCIKKYALTLFTSTALILVPYFGFSLESSKYFLPGPLGFMIATGFFRGNEHEYNIFTEQKDILFQEISNPAWMILSAITLCIGIGMFFVIIIRHTNSWSTGKRNLWLKPTSLALILCIIASGLAGCVSYKNTGYDVYNYDMRQTFENERYRFFYDDTFVFEDKKTGEIKDLVRNPMSSLTTVGDAIYGNGSFVYYIKYDHDKSKFQETLVRVSIIEVNTETFHEKIIFEKNLDTEKDSFLDLNKIFNPDAEFLKTVSHFFLDDHNIYFIAEDEIRKVDKRSGKSKTIIQTPGIRSVAFDGRYIYYDNEKSEIVRYDTKNESETNFHGLISGHFILTDTELLFINRKDQQKIYSFNLQNATTRKITDRPAVYFTFNKQYIFYEDNQQKKYRIDQSGHNEKVVLE